MAEEAQKTKKIGSRVLEAPTPDQLNGAIIGGIEAKEIIGKGGMGAVYKGVQTWLRREVAIKVLLGDGEEHGFDYRERFQREAQAMAALDHPNIVTIHDFGETKDGKFYFVMEFVDGSDLHTLIHGAELTEEHVFSWIPQVCRALQFAHDAGLVHRDVKPANIFITSDGRVKIGDFGLVKIRNHVLAPLGITQLAIPVGTPDYLAPEAAEAWSDVDGRADVYSLGVVLYEVLTGTIPRGAFTPPSRLREELNPGFDEIIVQALQPEREDRFQTIAEMGEAIIALQNQAKSPRSSRLSRLFPSKITAAITRRGRALAGVGSSK